MIDMSTRLLACVYGPTYMLTQMSIGGGGDSDDGRKWFGGRRAGGGEEGAVAPKVRNAQLVYDGKFL